MMLKYNLKILFRCILNKNIYTTIFFLLFEIFLIEIFLVIVLPIKLNLNLK
jgi:hypothetical protein